MLQRSDIVGLVQAGTFGIPLVTHLMELFQAYTFVIFKPSLKPKKGTYFFKNTISQRSHKQSSKGSNVCFLQATMAASYWG